MTMTNTGPSTKIEVTRPGVSRDFLFSVDHKKVTTPTIDFGPSVVLVYNAGAYQIWRIPSHTYASGQYRRRAKTQYLLVEIIREYAGTDYGLARPLWSVHPGHRYEKGIEALMHMLEDEENRRA